MCESTAHGVSRRAVLAGGAAVASAAVLGVGGRANALSLPAAPVAVGEGLAIWPRDAWAPGPPVRPLAAEDVRFLLVHHTAASTQHRASDVPGLLAAMYRFHTGEKAWPDIAYNFLVDREGGVWEGRAGSLAGPVAADASGGSQGFAQLVCFIGDFTGELPTAAALAAGTRTLAWLAQRYGVSTAAGATVSFTSRGSNRWPAGSGVTTATIAGHRDMSTTACPGNAFYPYVHNGLQRDVQALRGGSLSAPVTAAPATAAPRPPRRRRRRPRRPHHPRRQRPRPRVRLRQPRRPPRTRPRPRQRPPRRPSRRLLPQRRPICVPRAWLPRPPLRRRQLVGTSSRPHPQGTRAAAAARSCRSLPRRPARRLCSSGCVNALIVPTLIPTPTANRCRPLRPARRAAGRVGGR